MCSSLTFFLVSDLCTSQSSQKSIISQSPITTPSLTTLRIRLPNSIFIQGTFATWETSESVIAFVSECINGGDYYLFSSPPKRELQNGVSLAEQGLFPTAILYMGSRSNYSPSLRSELTSLIEQRECDVLMKSSHQKTLAGVVEKVEKELNSEKNDDDMIDSAFQIDSNENKEERGGSMKSGSGGQKDQPITNKKQYPKWFKPSGK
jgi:hypothetical protein